MTARTPTFDRGPQDATKSVRWAALFGVAGLTTIGWKALPTQPWLDATPDPWHLPESQPAPHEALALLAIADPKRATTDDLLLSATMVRDAWGPMWMPLAPPANERDGWVDTHALLLMPTTAYPLLTARLSNDAIDDGVEALQARLSSPFFAVNGLDARRDPLQLRSVGSSATWDQGRATATGAGDLMHRDGTSILMQMHSPTPEASIAQVQGALQHRGLTLHLVGPAHRRAVAQATLPSSAWRWAGTAGGALVAMLALLHRRVALPLGQAAVLALGLTFAGLCMRPFDVLMLPWLALALATGLSIVTAEGRIDRMTALVLGPALLPLGLLPIPAWATLAAPITLTGIGLGFALRAITRTHAAPMPEPRAHAGWQPLRVGALAVVALGGLSLAATHRWDTFAAFPEESPTAEDAILDEAFFDPDHVVWTWSTPAPDLESALEFTAADVQAWSTGFDRPGVRLASPGQFVLPAPDIAARRKALGAMDLEARIARLESVLQAHGFRPAAFGEFLRSAVDPDLEPSAKAALQSPLARWIERHARMDGDAVQLRSELHLAPESPQSALPLTDAHGAPLPFVGPALSHAALQASAKADVLGAALMQLWLGAFLLWLGRRRDLSRALVPTILALAHGVTLALALWRVEVVWSLAALPGWLWVSASTMALADRGTRHRTTRAAWLRAMATPAVVGATLWIAEIPGARGVALLLALGGPLGVAWAWGIGPRLLHREAQP